MTDTKSHSIFGNLNYKQFIAIFIALHVPIFVLFSLALGMPLWVPVGLQLFLAVSSLLAAFSARKDGALDDIVAISLVATPAVMVYQFSGSFMQLDAHMYFFAALAMLLGFKSMRTVLLATTFIALHHVILNFVFPYAVFPEGANFLRVLFHAVIVIIETAIILFQINVINNQEHSLKEESARAKQALDGMGQAQQQRAAAEEAAAQERKNAMKEIADTFDQEIGGIIASADHASLDMKHMSLAIHGAVEKTLQQAVSVQSYSQSASSNITEASQTAENLSHQISEITIELNDAAKTARECALHAEQSRKNLDALQGAVGEIDQVLAGINDVAEQTNLLALNATIEAARAGDAGKGFSVVANEVKSLAAETRKMTDEIALRIENIKSHSLGTVNVVGNIISQIQAVDGKTTAVARTIEEQSAAAQAISSNVRDAQDSTSHVFESIADVNQASSDGANAAQALKESAEQLSAQILVLKSTASRLVQRLRA